VTDGGKSAEPSGEDDRPETRGIRALELDDRSLVLEEVVV